MSTEPWAIPTHLDVHRALAVALAVSADELLFNPDERGPQDEGLRLHLTALDQLDPDERASIRALIEGALLRHQARRLAHDHLEPDEQALVIAMIEGALLRHHARQFNVS